MRDAVLIVIAVAVANVAFLIAGIWGVGRIERRARFDVTPAKRPGATRPTPANENVSQRYVRPGSPGS
jgi:FtsZ-interacting cell division protein ZipA